MAHLIESMAYVGETPWHGLGNQLSPHQPIEVWQRQAGMDWTIKEAAVRYFSECGGNLGAIMSFPDNKVLFRSDNHEPLSVVSQRYQVVQPHEILSFYRDLTEISGFELETAGVLKGGRKFWALARTGKEGVLKGDDRINGYLLLATACDGTLATTAQMTSIRVVCNNTLTVALNGATNAVKVPHSTRFEPEAVKKQLGISVSAWAQFMDDLKTLSDRKVKNVEVQNFFWNVFASDSGKPGAATNERAMAKAMELFEGNGMGSSLESSRGTAFGLLNAVTQYVDHERRARSTDYRLDSAWFGQGAAIKQRALDKALEMVA